MTSLAVRPATASPHVAAPFGPNWFASVMGTGIVGVAAATLPYPLPGTHTVGLAVWSLAALWLAVLTGAWAVHWLRHGETARGYAHDPAMAPFWGAVAMGVLTVGAGAVRFDVSVGAGWALWAVGTALGLVTAVWIPYMMIVHHRDAQPFGGWLMPVVPPMVSAANGALLIPHTPTALQPTMLLVCVAMFGISLFATLALLPQIWNRLVLHGPGAVPTMWIVLGPLGQSVTAAVLLGDQAGFLAEPYATGARVAGLLYGVPTWGFALMWLALAIAVTLRSRPPFALSWWSFTFPVGTCVTGTSALFAHTGLALLGVVATGLYVLLVVAWVVVAVRTVRWVLTPSVVPPRG